MFPGTFTLKKQCPPSKSKLLNRVVWLHSTTQLISSSTVPRWSLPMWLSIQDTPHSLPSTAKASHEVEWWVFKSLHIRQPVHKLNQSSAVWIQPSRQGRCSDSPVAAGFSSLCLHPEWVLIFICLIMKDQLEERLSAEKKTFYTFPGFSSQWRADDWTNWNLLSSRW